MHEDCIRRFFEVQYVLLSPICPHFCDYVRCDLLGLPASPPAAWPVTGPIDHSLLAQDKYLHVSIY